MYDISYKSVRKMFYVFQEFEEKNIFIFQQGTRTCLTIYVKIGSY